MQIINRSEETRGAKGQQRSFRPIEIKYPSNITMDDEIPKNRSKPQIVDKNLLNLE